MLRDGVTGDWIGTWSGHKGAVWSCRLDATGSLAATASGDFSIQIWDAITGIPLRTLQHKHIVKCVDFSPNSMLLASGGHEGILRIYNLLQVLDKDSKKKTPQWEIPQSSSEKIAIHKISWVSDNIVLTGCSDGMVRTWKLGAPDSKAPTTPIHSFQTEDMAEIRDMEVKLLNDGRTLLTLAAGSKVYFLELLDDDAYKFELLHTYDMPIHFREEGGASLHPSGEKFVVGGSDLWVRVFEYGTGKELECLKGHHGPIRCLRYSPDGTMYASGSEDGTIRLWKSEPEKEDHY